MLFVTKERKALYEKRKKSKKKTEKKITHMQF